MADVDIDPFGNHHKTYSHPDDTGEKFLFLQSPPEDLLRNQNMSKKRHLEEGELKKEGSPILMLTVCTKSYLSIIAEPLMQSITITLNARVGSFTSKAGMSHSPMRMES